MKLGYIKNHFTPTSILDVGAGTGFFYKEALNEFPDAYYYLIEGNPQCEEQLKSIGVDYFIGIFSDTVKSTIFYMDKNNPTSTGNSLYRENTEFFSDDNIILHECQTYTLDDVLAGRQFDLVKMDVQGSELDIIRGGLTVLSKTKGILLELSMVEYNQGAPLQHEVIDYMKSIGFIEAQQLELHMHPQTHQLIQRDVLFVNTNI